MQIFWFYIDKFIRLHPLPTSSKKTFRKAFRLSFDVSNSLCQQRRKKKLLANIDNDEWTPERGTYFRTAEGKVPRGENGCRAESFDGILRA